MPWSWLWVYVLFHNEVRKQVFWEKVPVGRLFQVVPHPFLDVIPRVLQGNYVVVVEDTWFASEITSYTYFGRAEVDLWP